MKTNPFLLLFCAFASVPVLAAPARAASGGSAVYDSNCSVCHQAGGAGSPGQYPVLRNRVDKIAGSPQGKAYLKDVLLNGLHGSIDAGGSTYMGFMPSFKALPDEQIAAVLTYVASLGDTTPAPTFTADEIKAARAQPRKTKEIIAERKALDAAHPLP